MSNNYKYYDYLKKYDAAFLNKYESWFHHSWGRRSNFTELLHYKSYGLYTGGRAIFVQGTRLKSIFVLIGAIICNADIWGVWFYTDIYNKFMPWKWINYQPYFKEELKFME